MAKKVYKVTYSVSVLVNADSKKEAIEKWNNGDSTEVDNYYCEPDKVEELN